MHVSGFLFEKGGLVRVLLKIMAGDEEQITVKLIVTNSTLRGSK